MRSCSTGRARRPRIRRSSQPPTATPPRRSGTHIGKFGFGIAAPPAQYYTVVKGDGLSKVARQYYGNSNEYMRIFEANRPLLSHPDGIYPGRNLRIPPK